jgi:hypothetical protein
MNGSPESPSRFPFRFLRWFCPPHLYEEIEGEPWKVYEYLSKNTLGVIMGMFSKGLSTSKSGSLVMMQLACPERASSKNISSFGSRHFETLWKTSINLVSATYRDKNLPRSAAFKYLLNLLRLITSFNSAYTRSEVIMVPRLLALSNALSWNDPLKRAALTNTLVSITKFNHFSFNSCSSNSGVIPCFWAYSLMSSITCRSVRLSSIKIRIISLNPLFSSWVRLAKRSANSSDVSNEIVFIQQI